MTTLRQGSDAQLAEALAGAAHQLDLEYELPLCAHAPMEPLNVVIDHAPGRCEIWTG